jgi:geranylgeranylglycerol-phosphate geranylgeranyltransferase
MNPSSGPEDRTDGRTDAQTHGGGPGVPASLMPGPLAIVRPRNLVLAAAGVAVGGFLALGRFAWPAALLWAIGSAIGLGAAGNAANDLFDVAADRINRPLRPLVTGAISRGAAQVVAGVAGGLGLWAAWWVSSTLFVLGLAALVVMLLYSPLLKPHLLLGNLAVAFVASMPLIFGAEAAGDWRAGLAPAVLAALLHLAREVVKDLEDVPGDSAVGRRTLPIVLGTEAGFTTAAVTLFVFIPASLVPWAAGWYGWRYGVPVLALDAGAVVLLGRLLNRRLDGVRAGIKVAMLVGLLALLWDRI